MMPMKMRYLLIVLLMLIAPDLMAQGSNVRTIFIQAEEAYNEGRVDYARQILQENMNHFDHSQRSSAYRMLTLCALFEDLDDDAQKYVQLLLKNDPNYTTAFTDPVRFVDLVNSYRHGAQITTASQQAESIEEAPVPVTLITEEMIRTSGARTLQELLVDYVPGMNVVEGEESNLSMRGVYSYSQENILILLNGVRLNSYVTNSVAPDYRIMLENIKQVEVLRGAASSLYGSVSLTAVVNIITKEGHELDGFKASVGVGNMHTVKGNILWGKSFLDTDIMAWASIYSSRGYRHDIPVNDKNFYGSYPYKAYSYVNGYNNQPAYDFGLTLRWKDFKLQLTRQHSKRVYTYTNMLVPTYYDYDAYQTIQNTKPGRSVRATIGNLNYSHTLKNVHLIANATLSMQDASLYNIVGDSIPEERQDILGLLPWKDEAFDKEHTLIQSGVFQLQNWKSYTAAGELRGMYDYRAGKTGKGNLLAGFQYNYFNLYFNDMAFGDHFNRILVSSANDRSIIFSNHREYGVSTFVQLKHSFNDHWLFNGGLRYDYKHRFEGKDQHVLSPRLSLIWKRNSNFNVLLSYARSYEDASYFYRASRIMYIGNENLNPQFLDNIQLSATLNFPDLHLTYQGNAFYHHVEDLITLTSVSYLNSGCLKSMGLEHSLTYQHKGTDIHANLYMQRSMQSSGYHADAHDIYAVPNVTFHILGSQKLTKGLSVNASMGISSRQKFLFYNVDVYQNDECLAGKVLNLPTYCLVNLGARYEWKRVELVCNVKNVFNHLYRLGGDRIPIYQEGRTFLTTVSYQF